jgi:hypothetical protein
VDDFLSMGVRSVWIIDPSTRAAYNVTRDEGWREVVDGVLSVASAKIRVKIDDLFC